MIFLIPQLKYKNNKNNKMFKSQDSLAPAGFKYISPEEAIINGNFDEFQKMALSDTFIISGDHIITSLLYNQFEIAKLCITNLDIPLFLGELITLANHNSKTPLKHFIKHFSSYVKYQDLLCVAFKSQDEEAISLALSQSFVCTNLLKKSMFDNLTSFIEPLYDIDIPLFKQACDIAIKYLMTNCEFYQDEFFNSINNFATFCDKEYLQVVVESCLEHDKNFKLNTQTVKYTLIRYDKVQNYQYMLSVLKQQNRFDIENESYNSILREHLRFAVFCKSDDITACILDELFDKFSSEKSNSLDEQSSTSLKMVDEIVTHRYVIKEDYQPVIAFFIEKGFDLTKYLNNMLENGAYYCAEAILAKMKDCEKNKFLENPTLISNLPQQCTRLVYLNMANKQMFLDNVDIDCFANDCNYPDFDLDNPIFRPLVSCDCSRHPFIYTRVINKREELAELAEKVQSSLSDVKQSFVHKDVVDFCISCFL